MIDSAWSWVLTGITCTGLWLAGTPRWRRLGWGISLANEGLWITYALITQQWGFVLGALVFAAVYGRNLLVAQEAAHA